MSILEPKELGVEYFKFEHNAYYREVQKQFMRAVDSHDPENILVLNIFALTLIWKRIHRLD